MVKNWQKVIFLDKVILSVNDFIRTNQCFRNEHTSKNSISNKPIFCYDEKFYLCEQIVLLRVERIAIHRLSLHCHCEFDIDLSCNSKIHHLKHSLR